MKRILFLIVLVTMTSFSAVAHDNQCDPDDDSFYCLGGHLYGPNNLKEWSGNTEVCGNSSRVKFGRRFACFNGYLIDTNGNKQWTGDTEYCGKHEIP